MNEEEPKPAPSNLLRTNGMVMNKGHLLTLNNATVLHYNGNKCATNFGHCITYTRNFSAFFMVLTRFYLPVVVKVILPPVSYSWSWNQFSRLRWGTEPAQEPLLLEKEYEGLE